MTLMRINTLVEMGGASGDNAYGRDYRKISV